MPRAAAALVALICWAGLGLQLSVSYGETGNIFASAWIMLRFFTVFTNLAGAVAMTWLALGKRMSPLLLGGLTLAMLLVGVVYAVLLAHLFNHGGRELLADRLFHRAAPIATAIYWLAFVPHGRLRWTAPLWWSTFPLAYLGYALARGQLDGKYPYPFIDVGEIGWAQSALNSGGIAFGFIVTGLLLVWIDRWPWVAAFQRLERSPA